MNRIDREKRTIEEMIGLYCRRKEGNESLCPQCEALLAYALRRLDACRFGNAKNSCRNCPAHCYTPAHRTKVREVMQYAGPRMFVYHPLAAIRHLLDKTRSA